MATPPTAALERLPQYNSEFYDPALNPLGLAEGGHIPNFPRALQDFTLATSYTAALAEEVADDRRQTGEDRQAVTLMKGEIEGLADEVRNFNPAPFNAHLQDTEDPHQSAAQAMQAVRGGVEAGFDTLEKLRAALTQASVDGFLAVDQAIAQVAEALSTHAANDQNPHGVTAAQVGLGQVDNTPDAQKPVSQAQGEAINARQLSSEKGQPNGYAPLGSDGLLPASHTRPLPSNLWSSANLPLPVQSQFPESGRTDYPIGQRFLTTQVNGSAPQFRIGDIIVPHVTVSGGAFDVYTSSAAGRVALSGIWACTGNVGFRNGSDNGAAFSYEIQRFG